MKMGSFAKITSLSMLIMSNVCAAASQQPEETLKITFDRTQEISLANKSFKIDGKIVSSATGQKSFVFGSDNGISLPAGSLFGAQGSILFKFKLDAPKKDTIPRYILTVRGKDKTWIGFARYPGSKDLTLAFRYIGQKTSLKTVKPIEFGRSYSAGCSWDGVTVKFYLDGLLQGEQPQGIPAVFTESSRLNIGPFKDGHVTAKPWQEDDFAIEEIRTYNTALPPDQIAQKSGVTVKPVQATNPTTLSVPKLSEAPGIDGVMNNKEWEKASSFISLIDGNHPAQSFLLPPNDALFGYDEKNLYIGFNALFPQGAKIQAGNVNGDKETEVWPDESFELYLDNGGQTYRFAGNVAGGCTESLNLNNAFKGDWKYKSTLKMQIDDRNLWQGEIAIPFKTLGIDNPDGRKIKVNFCRTWRALERVKITSLAGIPVYFPAPQFATLVFANNKTSFQQEQKNPCLGSLKQKIQITSQEGGNFKYFAELAAADGLAAPYPLIEQKIQINPGQEKVILLDQKIDKTGYDTIIFRLEKGNKSEIIMQQAVPFKLSENYFDAVPLLSSSKLMIMPKFNMLKNKLGGTPDLSIILADPSGKNLFTQKLTSDDRLDIPFSRENPPGAYKIKIISNSDNKSSTVAEKSFEYPGRGEWENATADNRIIPPFEPMKSQVLNNSLKINVWGRAFKWQDSLFPVEIKALNQNMITEPVTLIIDDKKVSAGTLNVSLNQNHRCEFSVSAKNDDYSVRENSWAEYDGLLWNAVEIKAFKRLNGIKLRITMPEDKARFFHAAAGGFGSSGGLTGVVTDKLRQFKFFPVMWLGNQEQGLCWFAESSNSWKTKQPKPISIIKANNRVTIEINLADVLQQGESLTFDFGLLATPVKPLPSNYPLNTFGNSYAVKLNREKPKAPTSYSIIYTGPLGEGFFDLPLDPKLPKEDLKKLKSLVEQAHSNNSKCIPYMDPNLIPDEYPEAEAFKDEWQIIPECPLNYDKSGKKHILHWFCPASDSTRFFAWKVKNMISQSDIDGLYFDFGQPRPCGNKLHGCDGRYPLLAMREFYRGVALAMLDANKKDYLLVVHNSESIPIPSFTFVTHIFDGEHFRQQSSDTLHDGKDALDTLTITDFAAEFSSLPWGVTASIYMPTDPLLPQFGGGKEDAELYRFRMTKAFMAGTLIHNSIPALTRGHFGLFDKLIRIYDEFGVPKAEFIPYWRNQDAVKTVSGKDIYVSLYKHAGKPEILAVISHVGKEHIDQEVVIEFMPKTMGFNKIVAAQEMISKEDPEYQPLLAEKNRIRIPLKLGDYGVEFKGLSGNRIKMNLKNHSFAIVKLTAEK